LLWPECVAPGVRTANAGDDILAGSACDSIAGPALSCLAIRADVL